MPKIKPCPKCGGIAVFDDIMGIMYQVRCYDCKKGTSVYWNKKKAIEVWNSYKRESEASTVFIPIFSDIQTDRAR